MITLTDAATTKIKRLLEKRGGVGIKVGVKTTGCSGLAYVLEYIDRYIPEPGLINYVQSDFAVVVDMKHEVYLQNMEIDYVRQGLNEGFEFKNPNERDRCGCGESFRV
jgi:iron-sulfur cluster assembly protein